MDYRFTFKDDNVILILVKTDDLNNIFISKYCKIALYVDLRLYHGPFLIGEY